MKPIILLFSLALSSISIAQTKLIAFKSHSGNMNDFYKLVKNRDIDMMPHNLGVGPTKIVHSAQLDSVIYVDDTTAVMITSVYCQDEYDPNRTAWMWNPGIDTITNNKVWNQDDPEAIKKDLKKKHFNFRNNMDSVVFINFPDHTVKPPKEEPTIDKNREAGGAPGGEKEDEDENEEEEVIPISNDKSRGIGIPLAITILGVLSIFIWLINWGRQNRPKVA